MTDDLDTSDGMIEDLPGDASGSPSLSLDDSSAPKQKDEAYRVLARKYRPTNFQELIGQAALVRTLSNAIDSGRIAHAFILTGVRGVGKTTTARIIARALNCTGPEGGGGPTINPCGICENCRSIADDRHVDVIEMDAASRTGIDDIRELIEGVRYRPVSARYKVYIIDEVHMLSRQAFNGLLKTLEEPPEHVIFIFATTEIRRLPVTVLSRCQRFDLRRVDMDALSTHFKSIAEQEGVGIEDEALTIISRAADGSVRDGLSLLDQAIALAGGAVTAEQIRDMLGLADRNAVFDLFDRLMAGDIGDALSRFETMYRDGADPVIVLQDLLDVTYWLTRVKVSPEIANAPGVPETERIRGTEMATGLPMPVLTRNWQMLLKGLGETQNASSPMQAAEMTLIRIAYAADVPSPAELARRLQSDAAKSQTPDASPAPSAPPQPSAPQAEQRNAPSPTPGIDPVVTPGIDIDEAPTPPDISEGDYAASPPPDAIEASPQAYGSNEPPEGVLDTVAEPTQAFSHPTSFKAVVELFEEHREGILTKHLQHDVHLVAFETGRVEFRPTEMAPRDLASKLSQHLTTWTGMRWIVSVSSEQGDSTLAQQHDAWEAERLLKAESHPIVGAVRSHFPGATVKSVTTRDTQTQSEATDSASDHDPARNIPKGGAQQ